ncbi:hypothetical protein GRI97_10735 [Altererythrobacter xixiisoli]|uniref:Uncharacterized protein n=2 Tax=Croceibacterium xixiisoli TaxID=1476466 RepID=A0A6I4TU77_9SPHN|nr:hypothetical protein [Croceibacterium xixiisoli]
MADGNHTQADSGSPFTRADGEALITQGAFLRFLFAAFETAGLFDHAGPAQGQSPRDLSFAEGRRSLGFDLLQLAQSGQPAAIRAADPTAMTTMHAVIGETLNPKEKMRDRRSDELGRYGDLGPG